MAREATARGRGGGGFPRFILLASICIVVAGLYVGREVLRPIALAILLAFLLSPPVTWLERRRVLPRAVAVLGVVVMAFLLIGGVGYVVYGQMADLADKLPEYKQNIEAKVQTVRHHFGGGAISKATKVVEEITKETVAASQPAAGVSHVKPQAGGENGAATEAPARPTPIPARVDGQEVVAQPVVVAPSTSAEASQGTPGQRLEGYLGYLEPLATAGLVVILVVFMLLEKDDLRDRVIRLLGHGRLNLTTQALEEAASRVSSYLVGQSMVNGVYGLVVGVGLTAIGVPNAALWGLLCALLRFVPYAGPWIGASMPVMLSVAVFPGMTKVLLTVGLFVGIEVLTSMVAEPLVLGARTGVSPLAILVGAAFWTWVWGPVGLVMATPLTVLLVVAGKYVPQLEFLSVMLGDEEVLEPKFRYYQRLLAEDSEDAEELIEEYVRERPLEAVYDEVVIPVLGMAERDLYHGRLDAEKHEEILNCIHEMVEGAWQQSMAKLEKAGGEEGAEADAAAEAVALKKARVMCLPARDQADEIAALMMAQVLVENGVAAKYQSMKALASEMLDAVDAEGMDVAVIVALPPEAVSHARYLVKRARARWAERPIVVSLLAMRGDLEKAKGRVVSAGTDCVAMTFAKTREMVRQQVQPFVLGEKLTAAANTQDLPAGGVATTREVPGAQEVVAAKENAGVHGRGDGAERERDEKTRVG